MGQSGVSKAYFRGLEILRASLAAILFAGGMAAAEELRPDAVAFTQLPYPYEAVVRKEGGTVWLQIRFGSEGEVEQCKVVRSTACSILEVYTVQFVSKNWHNPKFRNRTATVPVQFYMRGAGGFKTLDDFAPPPYQAKVGDPVRELTLMATFAQDGFISDCRVSHSSGDTDLDREVRVWAQVHWHHLASAGTTVDIPVELKPPVPASER